MSSCRHEFHVGSHVNRVHFHAGMSSCRHEFHVGSSCKGPLRRHFEGLEKISEWVDMNYWVLDVLDTPVKETLIDRDNIEITLPDRNSAAKDLQRKIKLYLMSGKNQDFRVVLSTIASIARNRLRH